MTENYEQVKNSVLDQYDVFLPLVMEIRGEGPATYDSTLNKLKKDIESIRKDVFRLMVVGEAKSGKSTFINAYLGIEILPMDVKQCSSAIVEIKYGERYILRATYADGTEKVITDQDEIKAFLASNAAIDDEYRDIPTGAINLHLIIPYEGRKPNEKEIDEFLKSTEQDNIYKLDPQDYSRRVREYIDKKLPHWKEIATKIEIDYPFRDDQLKGIHIVDSPGVNAEGRMGEITSDYIINANAVMFLKPVVGATLETKSFKKFLESASADRNPNAMFLVLTRAANETPDHVAQIQEEAYRQFPDINSKQIIHLDSKVELFRKRVCEMTEEKLNVFMEQKISEAECYRKKIKSMSDKDRMSFVEENRNADILDDFLVLPWYRSHNNRDIFIDELAELSNFAEMEIALNLFARKTHYILLSQALNGMKLVLKKIMAELQENIAKYKEKAQDPVTFEAKMLNIQEQLNDLQRKMNERIAEINSKYKDAEGIIRKRAADVISEYNEEIEGVDASKDTSVDELEKITFRKIAAFTEFEAEIQKNIVAECDKALIAFSDRSELNYISLTPDLTPDIIKQIKSDHYEQAVEKYKTGSCFKKEIKSRLNQSRFFALIANDILSRLKTIKNDLTVALDDYVTKVTSAYRLELARNIDVLQKKYESFRVDKANAEEMQEKIGDMETQLREVEPLLNRIISMKGGVDRNV